MSNHARFSWSASHRWLECSGSLSFKEPEGAKSSVYAERGTLMHAYAFRVLCQVLAGREVPEGSPIHFNSKTVVPVFDRTVLSDSEGFSVEELDCVAQYVMYVVNLARSRAPCVVMLEKRVNLTEDVWGTADAIVSNGEVMDVVDFKTGQGVRVEVKGNSQMMGYALSALKSVNFDELGHSYPKDCTMHIVQPPLNNISSWSVWCDPTFSETNEFDLFEDRVRGVIAEVLPHLADPSGPPARFFAAGEDQCRFCPGKAVCRARSRAVMQVAVDDFSLCDPAKLSPQEIAIILPQVENILEWARSVKEHAVEQALKGVVYPGFKLVEGRSNRKWRDDIEAIGALVESGIPVAKASRVYPITIGDAEKMLGKNHPLFREQCDKPQGKPTLVPVEDKRPEWADSIVSSFPSIAP